MPKVMRVSLDVRVVSTDRDDRESDNPFPASKTRSTVNIFPENGKIDL